MSPYQEPYDQIDPHSRELERARRSLCEELEAINWYQQRIDVTTSESLKRILEHNRDEEKEHAAMLMQWLLENDPEQKAQWEDHD